jgi:hypothetical protein
MADFIHVLEIEASLREPLRALLRGGVAAWPRDYDRDAFAAACEEHGIAPLVYARLALPELREQALRAAVTEPLRLADLQAVLAALDSAGVDALVLKGTALAHDLYASAELRPRADVDLLAGDFDGAAEVLRGLGFESYANSGDELALRQQSFGRVDAFERMHLYDLHREIANPAVFAGVLPWDELLARSIPLPRIRAGARGLSRIDALLLACVHRVAHHHDSDRLIWLYDIHLLRAALPLDEQRAFWRAAAERRVLAICRRSVALAEEWFGGAGVRAEEVLTPEELRAQEATARFLDRNQRGGMLLAASFAALPGWRARLRRLRQLAFPPRAYMSERFATRNRAVLPWLYALRGIRGLAHLFRRIA